MKSLAWKLATLAAVVGIGFLVLLQAQRGMNQAMLSKQGESQASSVQPSADPQEPAPPGDAPSSSDQPQLGTAAEPPSQVDPQNSDTKKVIRVPTLASVPGRKTDPDADQKLPRTAELTSASPTRAGSPAAADPFSESNDSKSSATTPGKTATTKGDVKQAGAFSDETPSKPIAPNTKTSLGIPAASDPPALEAPSAPTPAPANSANGPNVASSTNAGP